MNLPINIKCDVKANFTKPVTILIQKITNAIGVVYESKRMINKAKAESEVKLIKARTDIELKKIKKLGELELNDIQQRSVASFVYQQERKQHNIEQIISLALPQIPEDAPTENIDEDWLAYFFAHCELVSDKDMQSLWANMLAGEASEPSRFSKRTIDFVATMSKDDAELCTSLSQFVFILDNKATLLIYDYKNDVYKNQGIIFSLLRHLDSIGFITFSPKNMFTREEVSEKKCFYFDKPTFNMRVDNISVGCASLTLVGCELFTICGARTNNEFYDYVVNLWKEQDFIVDD
jgi:hypothetical protein